MRRLRWLSLLLLVLVLGGILAGLAYPWYQLRAGREAMARYRTPEARRHLDACLRFWPRNLEAQILEARAARRAGDFDAAEQHLNACVGTDEPRPPEVVLEWALLTAVKGDLPEVVPYLRAKADEDPAVAPLVWEAVAEGNIHVYRVSMAIEILDHWLAADPDNVRALMLRGDAHRQTAANLAADDYARVVELDPADDAARWALAVAQQEAGQFDKALPHLEYLRARGWSDPDLRPRIARSLDRVGRTTEARDLLDAVLADDPEQPLALRVRGQLELLAGDLPAAEKWLRAAVRVKPGDYQTHYALLQCLRQADQVEAARIEAEIAEKVRDRRERLAILRHKEIVRHPHDPALRCQAGVLCDSLGDTVVAEQWLFSALHEDPNYGPAHAALADFYERHQGDAEKVAMHRLLAKGAKAPEP